MTVAKKKPKQTMPVKHQHVQKRFAPLVVVFVMLVVLVSGCVAYLAFGNSVITVTVAPVPTTVKFSYTGDQLDAPILNTVVTNHDFTYSKLSSTQTQDAIATGTVTIYNHYSSDQPLVRTTRLLSDSGILFHTDKTVTVPVGGQVTVPVYADQAGAAGNIAPSKFTIVALWAGLKDKIYAQSTTAMTGGTVSIATVTASDVTAAKAAASADIQQQALTNLTTAAQTNVSGMTANTLNVTITNQTTTPAVGKTTDHITVTSSATVTGLAFTLDKLLNLLQQTYHTTITAKAVHYTVTITDETATVTGTVTLPQLNHDASFINRSQLVNKTTDQIITYLKTFPQVKTATVQFAPFWLQTIPPQLSNHIQIIIKS